MLFRHAYSLTRDPGMAEDIAQEAAVRIFKAWASEDLRGKIIASKGYACRIITNCFLDHVRVPARAGRDQVEFDETLHDGPDSTVDDDLRHAVLSLSQGERDVILFRYYHDLTFAEAGHQLGISPSQARRLHIKALASLAGLLHEGKG